MKPYGGGGDGLVPGFLNPSRAELGTSRPNPFHEYPLAGPTLLDFQVDSAACRL